MSRVSRVSLAAALAGTAAAAVVAQAPPAATGVVVVRTADLAGAAGEVAGLGFVAGVGQVIAHVGADTTGLRVSDAGGTEREARLVAVDEASGLALLAVPGLTAAPVGFAREPAEEAEAVYGAIRDAAGTVRLLAGRVLGVEPGAAASEPGVVRHDAFIAGQPNLGAPLLNGCGEVVGAVIDDGDRVPGSSGSGLAAPGAWLLARFAAYGLTATAVATPCLTVAERMDAAEASVAEAARRAAAAAAEAREAARRVEEVEADATERVAVAEAESEEAQQAAAAAAEAQELTQQRAEADRARYLRWIGVVAAAATALALVFWVVSRRSVARAKQDQVEAESLARAAQSDLADQAARDRLASAVPAVFLDGAGSDGRPIGLRIPGRAIADSGGAVVGRNPFESTIVLDHTEVSRRHFRLFARETAVFVEDLHSLNGTKLDRVPLRPGVAVAMRHGAVLHVGGLALTVTLDADAPGRVAGDDA